MSGSARMPGAAIPVVVCGLQDRAGYEQAAWLCLGARMRRPGLRVAAAFAFGIGTLADAVVAQAGGILTVGMTAGDIPVTTGNPDQGFEGYRFVGYNLYDTLILWDLSKADKASEIRPGLATSWEIDPNDHKRWIVHLRRGVKFHDGCQASAGEWCAAATYSRRDEGGRDL
jgi:hypothetical protein